MFQNQSLHPPDTQSMLSGAGSKGCAKASVYMVQFRDRDSFIDFRPD